MALQMKGKDVAAHMFDGWKPYMGATLDIYANSQDEASVIYVRNKQKKCEEFDIKCNVIDTSMMSISKLKSAIYCSQCAKHYILLQKPLVKNLQSYEQVLDDYIAKYPDIDIDAFSGDLKTEFTTPCTPLGILKMLKFYNIKLDGINAVVIGRSKIVGKPMADLLLKENCTVTVCHSHTKDIASYTKNADLVVVAVGKANFLTADMVKEGSVIIDVGINRNENGKVCGDILINDEFVNKVYAYSPVPGGVGPLTVASLVYKMGKK